MHTQKYQAFLQKKEALEKEYQRFLEENKQYYQPHGEQEYLDLLRTILTQGIEKGDRTGTGTKSVFGYQMRFALQNGFPLLTTKRVPFRLIVSELLWFIKGDTNIRYLLQHNNHIWDEWCFKQWVESDEYKGPDMTDFGHRAQVDEIFAAVYQEEHEKFCQRILEDDAFCEKYGSIGAGAYGAQWRSFAGPDGVVTDQLKDVIEQIKNNPDSRRHMVSAWNPVEIASGNVLLPPCHSLFQFYVADGKLSCQLYQRSGDTFLGIPFNIASYSLLTHMIAKECDLEVGEFVHTIGDAHIYLNHMDQVNEQLAREPKELPTLWLNPAVQSVFDYTIEDIKVEGYDPHGRISAPVAV